MVDKEIMDLWRKRSDGTQAPFYAIAYAIAELGVEVNALGLSGSEDEHMGALENLARALGEGCSEIAEEIRASHD